MQVPLENTENVKVISWMIDPGSVLQENRAPSEIFGDNHQEGQECSFIFRYNAHMDPAWHFLGGSASDYYKV